MTTKASKKVATKSPKSDGKKAKPARAAKKAGPARTTAAEYRAMAKGGKFPTVGEHFRARIVEGRLDNEAIVKEVRKAHGSEAGITSLYWNRKYLRNVDGLSL